MKEYQRHITRKNLRENPNKVYLFGDNLAKRGMGGQAKEMRGEENAIGIPTKKYPTMNDKAFFTDDEFESNKERILNEFKKIPKNKTVVVPSSGLGTGLAQLDKRAPKTYAFLQECINKL